MSAKPSINTLEELYEAIRTDATLGPEVAADFEKVKEDLFFGAFIQFIPADAELSLPERLKRAFDLLARRAPLAALPEALRDVTRAVTSRLPMRRILPHEERSRAPVNAPGIVRAALGMVKVGQRFASTVVLPIRLDDFGPMVILVETGQGVLASLGRVTERLSKNLGVWETRLLQITRESYPFMEEISGADEKMVDDLADTRLYIKGPALQGAATRKDNQRNLTDLTEKAAEKGQAAAKSSAWQKITQEFVSFLESRSEADSDTPEPAPANRRSPGR